MADNSSATTNNFLCFISAPWSPSLPALPSCITAGICPVRPARSISSEVDSIAATLKSKPIDPGWSFSFSDRAAWTKKRALGLLHVADRGCASVLIETG